MNSGGLRVAISYDGAARMDKISRILIIDERYPHGEVRVIILSVDEAEELVESLRIALGDA